MTERNVRDEGATQTRLIMNAVRSLRDAKGWSAERLADEMTAVGIPWNTAIVTNLELGRRKSLRVHELLALAYVLDAKPLDLLVPPTDRYPVTPKMTAASPIVTSWIKGEMSLRGARDKALAEFREVLEEHMPADAARAFMDRFGPMIRDFDRGDS